MTTVEGLISDIISDLSFDQPLRRIQDEVGYNVIQAIIDRLRLILDDHHEIDPVSSMSEKDSLKESISIRLDDPAGCSFVEFIGSIADPGWSFTTYQRTLQQNIALGLAVADDGASTTPGAGCDDHTTVPISEDEILTFPGICSSCAHSIETRMKKVNIPYFKVIQRLLQRWIWS